MFWEMNPTPRWWSRHLGRRPTKTFSATPRPLDPELSEPTDTLYRLLILTIHPLQVHGDMDTRLIRMSTLLDLTRCHLTTLPDPLMSTDITEVRTTVLT